MAKTLKVFCIGMYKTGTASFGQAMTMAGLRSFTGPWKPHSSASNGVGSSWNFQEESFLAQCEKELISLIDNYDAFNDYPFTFLYEWLAKKYPESLSVLLERDPFEVARSDRLMWERFGCPLWKLPPVEKFVSRYEKHHNQVVSFFQRNSQLRFVRATVRDNSTLDLIYAHLGLDGPAKWPYSNKAPKNKLYILMIRILNAMRELKKLCSAI